MLYIKSTSFPRFTCNWHVGEILPDSIGIRCKDACQETFCLTADGDELEHIRNLFPALTANNRRVVGFYGDIARTILMNLGN